MIQFEFDDWKTRPPAHELMDRFAPPDGGPARHSGRSHGATRRTADRQADPGFRSAHLIRMPCRRSPQRLQASWPSAPIFAISTMGCHCPASTGKFRSIAPRRRKYGAGPNTVGTALQLVTNGVKVTEYRPSDSDKAVDILLRFPGDRRSLDEIDELRIQTQVGHVPIGNFVERVPAQRVGNINRVAGSRVMTGVGEPCRWRSGSAGAEGHRRRVGCG